MKEYKFKKPKKTKCLNLRIDEVLYSKILDYQNYFIDKKHLSKDIREILNEYLDEFFDECKDTDRTNYLKSEEAIKYKLFISSMRDCRELKSNKL
jgi:hypothetical protein